MWIKKVHQIFFNRNRHFVAWYAIVLPIIAVLFLFGIGSAIYMSSKSKAQQPNTNENEKKNNIELEDEKTKESPSNQKQKNKIKTSITRKKPSKEINSTNPVNKSQNVINKSIGGNFGDNINNGGIGNSNSNGYKAPPPPKIDKNNDENDDGEDDLEEEKNIEGEKLEKKDKGKEEGEGAGEKKEGAGEKKEGAGEEDDEEIKKHIIQTIPKPKEAEILCNEKDDGKIEFPVYMTDSSTKHRLIFKGTPFDVKMFPGIKKYKDYYNTYLLLEKDIPKPILNEDYAKFKKNDVGDEPSYACVAVRKNDKIFFIKKKKDHLLLEKMNKNNNIKEEDIQIDKKNETIIIPGFMYGDQIYICDSPDKAKKIKENMAKKPIKKDVATGLNAAKPTGVESGAGVSEGAG